VSRKSSREGDLSLTIPCIALLGRKDEPTDAIEEYCQYLSAALQDEGIRMELHRVSWQYLGWRAALQELRLQALKWRGVWVLVQYTALSWSERGFPHRILRVLKILKDGGARVSMVFHDVEPYPGTRLIDSVRRFDQIYAMRRALALTDRTVFTVPPDRLSWLPAVPSKAVFIPVGPNLPIPYITSPSFPQDRVPTIGVFSITNGESGARETQIIVKAVQFAAQTIGKLRLSVFGRHAELRESELRAGLGNLPVELSVEGVIEPGQVVKKLSACDVLLFVRGHISSRRGSAIAGIASGLPIVAYSGSETAVPITEAGVVLVSPDHPGDLNAALVRVLSDPSYRMDLASRSLAVYKAHFAWPAIAARLGTILKTC
jgi:glycosyltransferase involved in cell wall biosynthesis